MEEANPQTSPQSKSYDKYADIPTEVIDLPSKGLVYPSDNPLSKGRISIKYMTAKEEDILASQNLVKKGIVLHKLFESVVVEPDVSIEDIIIGDKTAILLATRMLGYGKNYETEVTDPATFEKQPVTIDLSKIGVKDIDESVLRRDNIYDFTLPTSGKKIHFKLLTHGDELQIEQEVKAMERLSGNNQTKSSRSGKDVTTRLRKMIVSIDGEEDKGKIAQYVNNNLLAIDSKALRDHVKDISPDMDLTFEFTSNVTGETEVLSIPFGINFFYPSA